MTVSDDATRWRFRADAIVDVVRSLGESGPPPRGQPFFGLDHRGTPLALVEDLAARGIFRKYEHVLDLGAGLGATTRYLTSRLGCTATATAALPGVAAAGRLLTARAALDWQVFHAVADATCLPFSEAAFTHVWVLDVLPDLGPSDRVLAEAFRVLRPGGHLGIQDLVLRHHDALLAGRGLVPADTRQEHLERAGFLEVVRRAVDAARSAHQAGWPRVVRRLGTDDPLVHERHAIEQALGSDTVALVQFTARRP